MSTTAWPKNPSGLEEEGFAPDHDAFGIYERRVFEAAGQAAGIVDFRVGAAQVVRGRSHARHVAGVARLRVAHVGRTQHVGAVRAERAALAAGAHEEHDAFIAVLCRDAAVVLLDDVEGLVPRAALPFVGLSAMLRVALQGMDDAARIVHVVLERQATHAQAALGDLLVLVALDLDELALLVDVQLEAASDRMAPRRRPGSRAGDGAAVLLEAATACPGRWWLPAWEAEGGPGLHFFHTFPPLLVAMVAALSRHGARMPPSPKVSDAAARNKARPLVAVRSKVRGERRFGYCPARSERPWGAGGAYTLQV